MKAFRYWVKRRGWAIGLRVDSSCVGFLGCELRGCEIVINRDVSERGTVLWCGGVGTRGVGNGVGRASLRLQHFQQQTYLAANLFRRIFVGHEQCLLDLKKEKKESRCTYPYRNRVLLVIALYGNPRTE